MPGGMPAAALSGTGCCGWAELGGDACLHGVSGGKGFAWAEPQAGHGCRAAVQRRGQSHAWVMVRGFAPCAPCAPPTPPSKPARHARSIHFAPRRTHRCRLPRLHQLHKVAATAWTNPVPRFCKLLGVLGYGERAVAGVALDGLARGGHPGSVLSPRREGGVGGERERVRWSGVSLLVCTLVVLL